MSLSHKQTFTGLVSEVSLPCGGPRACFFGIVLHVVLLDPGEVAGAVLGMRIFPSTAQLILLCRYSHYMTPGLVAEPHVRNAGA